MWHGKMKRKIIYIYVFVLLAIFVSGVYLHDILLNLPSVESLKEYTPTLSTKIYDVNNELITELYTERRTWMPLSKIPVDMQNAVIAIEDHRFFNHWGISFRGIFRAMIYNIISRRVVAGGSTITQQLTKLAFLTQEKTLSRKAKELLLALQLEKNFSKQEILEMYLNQAYFGHGAYGVEQAAKVYFAKRTEDLDLSECAMLAGLIRYPNYYSPFKHPDKTLNRRNTVLARMRDLGFITEHEELAAAGRKIMTERLMVPVYTAPYFIEYVRLLLEPKYGVDTVYRAGWNVHTTLDMRMQQIAERVVEEFLADFDREKAAGARVKQRKRGTAYAVASATDTAKVQCALLALDPKTGQIRVMVGGRNFKESQFNRTFQSFRQVGSAFKPIVYAAAIEKGFTPATVIEDIPAVYVNNGREWHLASKNINYVFEVDEETLKDPMKVWVPENYKRKYYGKVLLRKALELSLNICAVRVIAEIGPSMVIDYARKFGIESRLTNNLSLALGSSDISLMAIVRAFGVFANRGILTRPYPIISIEDKDGKTIEEDSPQEDDVLSPQTSYVITNLLQGVVRNGTGRYALNLRRPCAGKTGTTNDFSDAWFIGYTPELICGVWVGYDNRSSLGDKMSGGAVACPIWTNFMKEALEDRPVVDFPPPPTGITFARIDPWTGLLAEGTSGYLEAFLSGTEPKSYATRAAKEPSSTAVAPSSYTMYGEQFLSRHRRKDLAAGTTGYRETEKYIYGGYNYEVYDASSSETE
jgi:penicillin-binding protein 1A